MDERDPPALVLLAAGRGTRMPRGGIVPKALVPLSQKAALTWTIDGFAACVSEVVVVASEDNETVIREYVELVHCKGSVPVRVVVDHEPRGPGGSLFAGMCCVEISKPIILTSCDTLWHDYTRMCNAVTQHADTSWMSTSAMPTAERFDPQRWCRIDEDGHIYDKVLGADHVTAVYTGLGYVTADDRDAFEDALAKELVVSSDVQVSAGFIACRSLQPLPCIGWLDIGDAAAYKRAVSIVDGYDWSKPDEITWVIKDHVVVKMWRDSSIARRRAIAVTERGLIARGVVPSGCKLTSSGLMSYKYVRGKSIYEADDMSVYDDMLRWYDRYVSRPIELSAGVLTRHEKPHVRTAVAARAFYIDKTNARIARLGSRVASVLVKRIMDNVGEEIVYGVTPGLFHGDFAFGNVLYEDREQGRVFVAVDWREDFAGNTGWGDTRYDVAKMLTSTVVHWERARTGDMRPWEHGPAVRELVRASKHYTPVCEYIGALSLLNSAPLHTPPLDEILIARACEWVEDIEGV